MNDDKGIMEIENKLPENFDGVFKFTNPSDEDFVGKWGGKEYHYPANTTSSMIIPEHSPIEIQQIRKQFAKNLAEREYFKSQSMSKTINMERPNGVPVYNSIQQAGQYTINDLAPYIQKCLSKLDDAVAEVKEMPKEDIKNKLTRNEDGELNTTAIDQKKSLRDKALQS